MGTRSSRLQKLSDGILTFQVSGNQRSAKLIYSKGCVYQLQREARSLKLCRGLKLFRGLRLAQIKEIIPLTCNIPASPHLAQISQSLEHSLCPEFLTVRELGVKASLGCIARSFLKNKTKPEKTRSQYFLPDRARWPSVSKHHARKIYQQFLHPSSQLPFLQSRTLDRYLLMTYSQDFSLRSRVKTTALKSFLVVLNLPDKKKKHANKIYDT